MKKIITLVMMLLLAVVGAKATDAVYGVDYRVEPAVGAYYIQDFSTGKYFNPTNGNTSDTPTEVVLISGDNTEGFLIRGNQWNTYLKLGNASPWLWYNDNVDTQVWKFNSVAGETKVYTISSDDIEGSMAAGTYYIKSTAVGASTTDSEAGKWVLVNIDTYQEGKKAANAASLIPNTYYESTIPTADGTYYMYNVVNGMFFNPTSRTFADTPTSVSFVKKDDNQFLISGNSSTAYLKIGTAKNELNVLWGDGNTTNTIWQLTADASADNTFTISTYSYEQSKSLWLVDPLYLLGNIVTMQTLTEGEWALITSEQYAAYQAILVDPAVVATNKTTINTNGGDITSMLSTSNFEDGTTGWTGFTGHITNNETWRGDQSNKYIERTSDGIISYTLSNMPAGTYKVVAAVRSSSGRQITPSIAGTSGSTYSGLGNSYNANNSEINTNGVQMPTSNLGGFTTINTGHNWQWATATGTIAADGALVIAFNMIGNQWMSIDDVHLYCLSVTDGSLAYTPQTVDLIVSNPNTITTSATAITTAAGVQMNNNLLSGTNTVANLVLYDGYEFSAATDFTATSATIYRSISADAFATVCAPFAITGGADGSFYQPTSLTSGTLNFGTEASPAAGKPYLYKASSAVTALTGSGTVKASPVDNGTGVTMKGTFSKITAVPTNDYVLSGTNLYKVNSPVSLNPFRAYFTVADPSLARISLAFDDDNTTGINAVNGSGLKVNGSLQGKASEAEFYNLNGQRVNNPTKGLYIVNGKKVIVK